MKPNAADKVQGTHWRSVETTSTPEEWLGLPHGQRVRELTARLHSDPRAAITFCLQIINAAAGFSSGVMARRAGFRQALDVCKRPIPNERERVIPKPHSFEAVRVRITETARGVREVYIDRLLDHRNFMTATHVAGLSFDPKEIDRRWRNRFEPRPSAAYHATYPGTGSGGGYVLNSPGGRGESLHDYEAEGFAVAFSGIALKLKSYGL